MQLPALVRRSSCPNDGAPVRKHDTSHPESLYIFELLYELHPASSGFVQFGPDIDLSAFKALLLCVHRPRRLDTDLLCQGIVSHHCFEENELIVVAITDSGDVCRYGYNNGTTQT
jgi:hypothetical protein